MVPIAHPVCAIAARAWYARAARQMAPGAPGWFLGGVIQFLLNPHASSDALLALADALEEAAHLADMAGDPVARELRELADLPRQLAPSRASKEA